MAGVHRPKVVTFTLSQGIESRELNPAFGQLAPGCPGIEKLD